MEILLAVPRDENGEMLARELSRTRCGVRRVWPLPPRLPEAVDVMFCELVPELPQCLPWVCAVTRRRFPVGANPTRRTLQPEAAGAAMEVTK